MRTVRLPGWVLLRFLEFADPLFEGGLQPQAFGPAVRSLTQATLTSFPVAAGDGLGGKHKGTSGGRLLSRSLAPHTVDTQGRSNSRFVGSEHRPICPVRCYDTWSEAIGHGNSRTL